MLQHLLDLVIPSRRRARELAAQLMQARRVTEYAITLAVKHAIDAEGLRWSAIIERGQRVGMPGLACRLGERGVGFTEACAAFDRAAAEWHEPVITEGERDV